ncbi:helix-turn-helix domain-containing protein [Natrinema sp. SYSU A 869]|uniref:helix-turn-helix domain-containing protein n=1 Tax=Natrinema sp. SYSU A 869 TaxID=2871694 RepID=UPI001CA3CF93|nr:helix-turn-helix domain-containing protein [Natrinema sp. SYSU A 869]
MLIATVRLDLDAVALDQAFDSVPGMSIEAERIAAHSTEWTMPCLWVAADDFDAVTDALAADPSVDTVIETDEFGDERYYHLDWNEEVIDRITAYVDREGAILEADATDDGWELEIRFVGRDQFDTFRETVREQGNTFELLNIYEPGSPRQTAGSVTPSQRDALATAVELGYYEVPRAISIRELADELDMAHQSVSELLRRGTENLVSSHLVTTAADDQSRSGDAGR